MSLPRFSVQNAQTQVRIQNGETIGIGGLVKEVDTKVVEKVPILGDIPIIGLLFKNVARYQGTGSSDPVKQDLLIFVTVRLLEEDETPGQAVAAVPAALGQ